MSGSINVLVKDKETQQESIITYKSFRDVSYRYDLVGQVDDNGNLMQSDPNLSAQHQRKVSASDPVDANTIKWASPPELDSSITVTERSEPISINFVPIPFHVEHPAAEPGATPNEPIKERKKPGPKPKNKDI